MTNQTPELIKRLSSPELDAILGEAFPVLDDGFVRVVDYMGTEASIVQAARVSYGKGTKTVSDDVKLLRHLMRHHHDTPYEMCELKLHVRVPMDTWRQWIRHRIASVNEYSTRYSEAIDSMAKTAPDAWRRQATHDKQGSGGALTEWPASWERTQANGCTYITVPGERGTPCIDNAGNQDERVYRTPGEYLSMLEQAGHAQNRALYEQRLAFGMAREQARKDLPLSTYTEAYWKIDLRGLLHFLNLRMDPHAQQEIRDYANTIGRKIVAHWLPNVWTAFLDYRLQAMQLTRLDRNMLTELINPSIAIEKGKLWGWLDENGKPRKNRELEEFLDKAAQLGITVFPWDRPGE